MIVNEFTNLLVQDFYVLSTCCRIVSSGCPYGRVPCVL